MTTMPNPPEPVVPLPKYAKVEIERRWLADLEVVGSLDGVAFREIEDVYFPGTGLRLRKVEQVGASPVFKLCKKYGKCSAFSEAVTNLYLSEAEYKLVLSQSGDSAERKRRYGLAGGSLDVYCRPGKPSIFEVEFQSEVEALAYVPPAFAGIEVTNNPAYSGAALAEHSDRADRGPAGHAAALSGMRS